MMHKVIQVDIVVRTTFEISEGENLTPKTIQHRLTLPDMYRVVKTEIRSEVNVER